MHSATKCPCDELKYNVSLVTHTRTGSSTRVVPRNIMKTTAENYRRKMFPLEEKIHMASILLENAKPIVIVSFFGNYFDNPYPTWRGYTIIELPLWKSGWLPQCEIDYNSNLKAGIAKHNIDKVVKPVEEYRRVDFNKKQLKVCPEIGKLKATWFGHSSVLLQFSNGLNCFVDPVFSERCSPVQYVGPARNTKVPMGIESLEKEGIVIHLVLVSHDHYDHLDKNTIAEFKQHFPKAEFIIPTNTTDDIKSDKCHELSWWQHIDFPRFQAKVTAVPAQHWTQRNAFDKQKALWSGYVIECAGTSCYFAGDTGYCQAFTDIGRLFPELTLALIPIGAYLPRWFMGPQHISPEEAVQVFQDLGCKNALGIHWLTFDLADDRATDPVKELEYFKLKIKENKADADKFIVTAIGVTKEYE